jgi:hypothetical protein
MRVTVLWFVSESMFQDEIDHRGSTRKVSISGRNMHRMRSDGKSIVQLVFVPRRFPNRPWANKALGVWRKEASTDRRLFEANTGLTFKEAASSIDD